MAQLLHIDASPRGQRSHTRRLTKELVDLWKKAHSDSTVVYRDVGRHSPPHVDEAWIAAAFTPPLLCLPQARSQHGERTGAVLMLRSLGFAASSVKSASVDSRATAWRSGSAAPASGTRVT